MARSRLANDPPTARAKLALAADEPRMSDQRHAGPHDFRRIRPRLCRRLVPRRRVLQTSHARVSDPWSARGVERGADPPAGRAEAARCASGARDARRRGRAERAPRHIPLGESPPPTAATSLQNAVSQLRKALGAEVVETRAPGYALNAEKDDVDARRFERLLSEARSAAPEDGSDWCGEALRLWRGPALGDFAYEAFAQNEASRLDELRLTAVEDRIEAELELGRPASSSASSRQSFVRTRFASGLVAS